jgi:hypothetical protein
VCALAALASHAFLIGAAIYGGSSATPRAPSGQGMGASAIASTEEPTMTLIFIEGGAGEQSSSPLREELTSRGSAAASPTLTIISPDSTLAPNLSPADERKLDAAVLEEDAGSQQQRAALFGRYRGQIQARVERAWLRPRTGLAEGAFDCRVRIVQGRLGEVQEVTLQECNGDARWQLSLVQGIQSASPLPAPPDPSVFVTSIDLQFHADPYSPGRSEDGYAPVVIAAAAAAAPPPPAPALDWQQEQ